MITVGSKVRKRGFKHEGVVDGISGDWVNVVWPGGKAKDRPRICHSKELELIKDEKCNSPSQSK